MTALRDTLRRATTGFVLACGAAAVCPVTLVSAVSAQVVDAPAPPLPPLDLGQTNILDGEGGPGAVLEVIGFGSHAWRLTDANGDDLTGRNRQEIVSLILHPILVSKSEFWGAHPGFEVLLPVTYVENDFTAAPFGHRFGLGDVTFAPFLQWSDPDPGPGSVSARLALQVVAPTGDFENDRPVNTGQGGWQVSPYLAATWRTSERWEISGRAIYGWSESTSRRLPDGSSLRVRPGDFAALNLSASYEASPGWRVGLGGYALQQLHESTAGGDEIEDSRERVFAFGPVTRWQSGKITFLAAAFGEFGARNRPEGVNFNLRVQRPF